MKPFRLMLAVAACSLAPACNSAAQAQGDYAFPDCLASACFYVKLEPVFVLQTSGGDIRSIPVSDFVASDSKDAGTRIQVAEGTLLPPVLDEIVRISIDLGEGEEAVCTGVALGRDAVLTAGHCACSPEGDYSIFFPRFSSQVQPDHFHPPRKLIRTPVRFAGYDCRDRDLAQPGRDLGLLFLEPRRFSRRTSIRSPRLRSR